MIGNAVVLKMRVSFRKECRSLADGTATSLKKIAAHIERLIAAARTDVA